MPAKNFKYSSDASEISQAALRSGRTLAALSLRIRLNPARGGHHSDTRPGMMTPPIPARCSADLPSGLRRDGFPVTYKE
jgi:hypothetical protein